MNRKNSIIKLCILLLLAVISLLACKQGPSHVNKGVVVTSPEVTEIIAELGGLDKIVARTKYCDYPPELLKVESVGDFSSIDIERVISLKPKIIFTAAFEQEEFYDKLKPFGIEVIRIHSNSLEAYYNNVRLIAKKLDLTENADKVINDFEQSLASLKLPNKRPKVYFEISSNLGTVTDKSFIGQLISKAGGDNIFANTNQDFFISKNEDIVAANPDVIIALSYVSKEDIVNRRGWQNINAVQKGNIYTVEDIDIDTVMRTIPRSSQALRKFNTWFLSYDKEQ